MNTNKLYTIIMLLMCCFANATAANSWEVTARAGYSIGGTVPFSFPAELRHINSFSPKANYRIGIDAECHLCKRWGVMTGVWLERKGFSGDMAVKQYDMKVIYGGDALQGSFTGNVNTEIIQTGVTVPLMAALWLNQSLRLKAGPYIMFVTDPHFSGYAYDGYMRKDSSTGPRINMGNEEGTRGDFSGDEFNDGLRCFQWGVNVGCDWFLAHHWGVYADISCGLNRAFHSNFETITMGLYPLYGTFGVAYKF